jgi:predicted PurR-regulated permease PerM
MADKNENQKLTINIDIRSMVIFFAVLISMYLIYLILDVLILVFLGSILALALEPSVEYLKKKKIPHSVSVLIVILTTLLFAGILGSIAFAPLIQQTRSLIINVPFYTEKTLSIPGIEKYTDALLGQLNGSGEKIFNFTLGAFSGALSFLVMITFTVYLLLDFENFRRLFIGIFPPLKRKDVQKTILAIETKLKDWLRGQVILMFIIGILSYIGLIALGLEEYALALAVIAGVLEVIPVIGPIISLVPAAIIGFTVSPALGIGVIGLYTIIQQAENQFIVPKVMQKAVGINPIVTIVAFMIGAQLMGVLGAIISLPVLLIVSEIAKSFIGYDIPLKEPKEN